MTVRPEIKSIIDKFGFETVLFYLCLYISEERSKGDEKYLRKLHTDLSKTLANYQKRN
jgi:hypothetical protein